MPIADPRNRAIVPRQAKAMLYCDLRMRWKVASDLRFRAAISEPKTPSFCGISGDLAQSTRKSLAIAIVRFWCAKRPIVFRGVTSTPDPDTCEKYRDTPPICIAIFWQKYALLLAESSIYTTNLYHDTPPICIVIPFQKH